jgi:hypothetical protein
MMTEPLPPQQIGESRLTALIVPPMAEGTMFTPPTGYMLGTVQFVANAIAFLVQGAHMQHIPSGRVSTKECAPMLSTMSQLIENCLLTKGDDSGIPEAQTFAASLPNEKTPFESITEFVSRQRMMSTIAAQLGSLRKWMSEHIYPQCDIQGMMRNMANAETMFADFVDVPLFNEPWTHGIYRDYMAQTGATTTALQSFMLGWQLSQLEKAETLLDANTVEVHSGHSHEEQEEEEEEAQEKERCEADDIVSVASTLVVAESLASDGDDTPAGSVELFPAPSRKRIRSNSYRDAHDSPSPSTPLC